MLCIIHCQVVSGQIHSFHKIFHQIDGLCLLDDLKAVFIQILFKLLQLLRHKALMGCDLSCRDTALRKILSALKPHIYHLFPVFVAQNPRTDDLYLRLWFFLCLLCFMCICIKVHALSPFTFCIVMQLSRFQKCLSQTVTSYVPIV